MDYFDMISRLLICAFESYIFYDFFQGIFEFRKKNAVLHIVIFTIMTFVVWGINSMGSSLLNFCLIPLILLGTNWIVYQGTVKKRIFFVILIFAITIGIELLFEIVISVVCGIRHMTFVYNPYSWLFILMIEKTLTLIFFRLIKAKISKTGNDIDNRIYKWVYILPITSLFLFAGFFYSEVNVGVITFQKVVLVIGCFLLLFSNALIFYLFERTSQIMYESSQLKLSNMQNDMENKHYRRIEEVNQEHNKYIHNLKHYLATIGNLTQQGKNSEVMKILEESNTEIHRIQSKTYCEHPILNAILCDKESITSQKNIAYTVTVDPLVNLYGISDFDLIAMINNLLDNAVEAAEKCKETPYITVEIYPYQNRLMNMIQITNSTDKLPIQNGTFFQTWKKDKEKHGIGLRSVKEIAERNKGYLDIETQQDKFEARLILPVF